MNENNNEFEKILDQYEGSKEFGKIIDNIADRIIKMSDEIGARQEFFKDEGPNSVYRFRSTGKKFRILCLRYGNLNIIIGGSAIKSSGTRSYQENPEYYQQVKILQAVDYVLAENEIDFTRLKDYTNQIFEIEV